MTDSPLPLTETKAAANTHIRTEYALSAFLTARSGQIYITGTQALVRLPLMQRWLDEEDGLKTAGFISGYRGSPLGAYDQQLWRARKTLVANNIEFLPAINEELGGTAVLGSQQVENDPNKTVAGVFGIWYGKGPGVDRAGDALKHGNAYGSSPHGGVLVVAGDDHGCMSSSMPHQSDQAMQSWSMPILNPANLADVLEFGMYGWALSRFSGAWVGLKSISETIESSSTVDLDKIQTRFPAPPYTPPPGGLHYRWPDLPSLQIETRLAAKLDAVRVFARANSIDKVIIPAERADIGIVTCGKAHLDLLEALRRLGLGLDDLAAAGVRLYKVGLSFPIEPRRMRLFAQGLKEVLVIEEKAPIVERQMRELLFNARERPVIIGKEDADGAPLLSALGELRPSRLLATVADWLARHRPTIDRRHLISDFLTPELLSNVADSVKRVPYFCSGCPHNTSTKVPEGSLAQAGIGCHFMASWMPDRPTTGLIQMGGEGVDWAAHSRFTSTPHVFQNLGDGTYFHSGYLAIRQSIAAGSNITYKILFNDAVAMTGGQPVDGGTPRRCHRAPGRVGRRHEGRRRQRRAGKVQGAKGALPGRGDIPRSFGARRRAAAAARDQGRHRADLRSDLRRREASPPQEGRLSGSAAADFYQHVGLRTVRRLRRAVELPLDRAGRDRAWSQADDRAGVLQQGLLLRERFLSQLCFGDRGKDPQEGGRGARGRYQGHRVARRVGSSEPLSVGARHRREPAAGGRRRDLGGADGRIPGGLGGEAGGSAAPAGP